MRQEIIDLYDAYTHETLDRRAFMNRLAILAGGVAAATAMLPLLEASSAKAAIVSPTDRRVNPRTVTFEAGDDAVSGYMVRRAGTSGGLPGIVVIHENRGLNPHIRDVTRRAALAGYLALAPDYLSPAGGTPEDQDRARELMAGLESDKALEISAAAAAYLKAQRGSSGRVGVVGFCWGGGLANRLAATSEDVDAAVAFYGRVLPADEVAGISAPLMLHYAGLDERINQGIPAFQAALEAAGTPYVMHMYEGVNHAFHNDTSEARYDRDAAELAWNRTLAFFNEHL